VHLLLGGSLLVFIETVVTGEVGRLRRQREAGSRSFDDFYDP